jgi:hypothetical protein
MILYHTVEDRDNPEYINSNAPFICTDENAWLGKGFYFWDTIIENAHWWGKVRHHNKYVIVKHTCDSYSNGRCFDLHGNMEHLMHFNEIIEFLASKGFDMCTTTVAKVIEYLKIKTDFLCRYDAIRAYGHLSKKESYSSTIPFVTGKRHYLERTPAVQLCLFNKTSLNLSKGKIVHPNNYNADYLA